MSLALCNSSVDERGRETAEHGTAAFPIACYHDDLAKQEVPWHWHEELEAAVLTEGCAVVAAGNEKRTLHVGEGFFVNSGILHGAWDAEQSGCRFHSLVFHARLVGGGVDSVFFQKYVQPLTGDHSVEGLFFSPAVAWQQEALSAIEYAWQVCVQEPRGYEFKARGQLSELLFLLQDARCLSGAPPSRKTLRDGERVKQMLQFVQRHYGDALTVADIAQSAAVSESECLRCFRAAIGITPNRYLRQYRIQQACQLLTVTQERISDIAARCGFQDMSYFTKTFRMEKGVVPSEYRKTQQT